MAIYQIETSGGVYEIETEEPKQIDRTSPEYQASVDPKALALQEMSKGKFIPQMTKAIYEGLPFGKRAISAMPNAEEIQRNIEMTPEAQGFKAGAGKFVGEIASMAPAIAGAEAVIPAKLLAASVGVGAQRGGQVLSEDKGIPQAIGEAAIAGGLTFAGGKALESAGRYIAKKMPAQVLNPLRPAEEEISKETTKVIKEGVNKAIRPSVTGKGSATQQEAYYSKAESAVKDVIANKDNLEIVDAAGNIVTGRSPKSLSEMLQAVGQTKENIFNRYAPMIEEASSRGASVDGKAIAEKLIAFANQEDVKMANPELAKYALDVANRWADKNIPLTTAENVAKRFNAMLKQKYQQGKITGADVSSAHVDDMVVRHLRNEIAEKAGVADLKARYGALANLETDLARRVVVAGRQNPVGLVESMANLQSGADIAGGVALSLATQNPAYMGFALRGLGAKAVGNLIKGANSPDANIARMFSKVEQLQSTPVKITPQTETASKLKTLLKTATPEEKRVIERAIKSKSGSNPNNPESSARGQKEVTRNPKGSRVIERKGIRGNKGEIIISRRSADDPLKYKTAEEYVASKINMYHGSPKGQHTELKVGEGAEFQNVAGVYLTKDKTGALKYTKVNGEKSEDRITEVFADLKNPASRADLEKIWKPNLNGYEKQKLLKERGFDGLVDDLMGEVVVFDPKQIKTKSQLTAEWQAAQKAGKK